MGWRFFVACLTNLSNYAMMYVRAVGGLAKTPRKGKVRPMTFYLSHAEFIIIIIMIINLYFSYIKDKEAKK